MLMVIILSMMMIIPLILTVMVITLVVAVVVVVVVVAVVHSNEYLDRCDVGNVEDKIIETLHFSRLNECIVSLVAISRGGSHI